MSLTTELGQAVPLFSQGDVIVTSPLSEAKENLVPRTGLEKGSGRHRGGQSDPNTLEVLPTSHQRVWTGHGRPDGDGDNSVPEVFWGEGEGTGNRNAWDSGPTSAINKPCDLGRSGSPTGH